MMDVVVSSAWTIIAKSLRVDISFIGVLVMISYMGSISISPNTYRVRQKIGTNYTMILTLLCYVVALLLLSFLLSQGVIITFNSLVSTVIVSQGKMEENIAVGITVVYFSTVFLGRAIFAKISEKIDVMKILKINGILAVIIFILLFASHSNQMLICVLVVVTAFIVSPIIPFLNSFIKESFDVTFLSALLGYGDVFGVLGIIIMSGLSTLIIKMTSIQVVEVIFAVLIIILYLLLKKIDFLNHSNKV